MKKYVLFIYLYFALYYESGHSQYPIKRYYVTQPKQKIGTTPYVPKVVDNTCHLFPQRGPCRAGIKMFYFNSTGMNCSTFSWGGCMGNGNRFDSYHECMGHCLNKPNSPNKAPVFCQLNFDYGFCFGNVERWYYDRLWKVCKKTIYSGCGGNFNNFYTKDRCNKVCVFGVTARDRVTTTKFGDRKILIVDPADGKKAKSRKTTKRRTTNYGISPIMLYNEADERFNFGDDDYEVNQVKGNDLTI